MRFLICLLGCLLVLPAASGNAGDDGDAPLAVSHWLDEPVESGSLASSSAEPGGEGNAPGGEQDTTAVLAEAFDFALDGGIRESQDDGYAWEPVIYGSGFTAEVMVSTVWDDGGGPALYVGGMFQTAGSRQAFGIVRWDGGDWEPLGLGVNGTVRAMIEFEGDLIVAGDFTQAAGDDGIPVEVNNIARWDGQAWSPVGAGFSGSSGNNARVLALAVHQGELIAGGGWLPDDHQSTSWIARWNGGIWLPLGEGVDGAVWDLTVMGDDLIAAGTFTNAGGQPARRVARWDGQQWSALGAGMDNAVIRLAVFNGELIAGGPFSRADGALMNHISRWNGSEWTRMGTGVVGTQGPNVRKLDIFNGELIVAGTFTHAGGQQVNHIARWDGSAWSPLNGTAGAGVSGIIGRADGLAGAVSTVSVFNGELVAGGMFYRAGGARANYIARWDGSEWAAMPEQGTGLVNFSDINNGVVRAVAEYDGKLIAGGGFHDASSLPGTGRIAAWDGTQWSALGPGIDIVSNVDDVNALTVFDGDLIVGGGFAGAGGVSGTARIARWDGTGWSSIGGGLSGAFPGQPPLVSALIEHGGDLFAAGTFTQASGQAVNGLARWDGSQWHPLGAGVNGQVHALAVMNGELFAAGNFTLAGGAPAGYIARWDGSQWHEHGSGANASVTALAVVDGELIAAGNFTQAGGVGVNRIARWDGNQWFPLGDGLMRPGSTVVRVSALTVLNGDLFVAGLFSHAGNQGEMVAVSNIARWDGAEWWPLSGPMGIGVTGGPNNPWLFSLGSYDPDGPGPAPRKLVAGGFHMLSGGVASWGLGFYGPVPFTAAPEVLDFGALTVGQSAGPLSVTVSNNGGGSLTVTDIAGPGAPFMSAGGTCDPAPFTLPPGAECALDFLFEPAAAGAAASTLVIVGDAGYGDRTVELRGVAGDGALAVVPPVLEFEPVAPGGTSQVALLTLTNAAAAVVQINGIDSPTAPFAAEGGSCGAVPFSLAPQATCTLAFVFEPDGAGSFIDMVEITHDAAGSPAVATLSGTGAERILELAPAMLDFGAVPAGGDSEPAALTLSNTSAVAVNVSGISGPDAEFTAIGGSCGAFPRELAPGEHCQLYYRFQPVEIGLSEATFTVLSDAQSGLHIAEVQGTGTGAVMLASPDGLSVITDQDGTATRTLSITNEGNDTLNWQLTETRAAGMDEPPVTISHSESTEVLEFNGIACNIGLPGGIFYTAKNAFLRTFALDDFLLVEGFEVSEVTFGVEALDARVPVALNLYLLDGLLPDGNLTPVGHATKVLEPQALNVVTVPVTAAVPPRATLVVEIEVPDLLGLAHFFPGTNNLGESAPTYWVSSACNVNQPTPLESAGYPGVHMVMSVTGRRQVDCALPDWIAVSPAEGDIATGGSQSAQLAFDAAGLSPGDHHANLCLQGNDPLRPVTAIPLSLTVNADILFQDRFE